MATLGMGSLNVRQLSMKAYRKAITDIMVTKLKAVEAGDYKYNLPTFVWGMPGIGKSMIIVSICRDTWVNAKDAKGEPLFDLKMLNRLRPWDASGWNWYNRTEIAEFEKNPNGYVLMDVRLSQVDPVEIKGAPFYDIKNLKAGFIRFSSILPAPDFNFPCFLLLDELPLAPDMVQSAAYQLINDRKVGDYRLPDKTVVIAAGNPSSCPGVNFEMGLALENRFDHIALDIDYDGFAKYVSGGNMGFDETMVAFLQYSKEADKDALYHIEGQHGKGNFPTFRSWEKALTKVKYGYKEFDAIADSVGQACASKFDVFKELTKDIPDVKTLVDKKMYFPEVAMQLVASQKVGNTLLNKDLLAKIDGPRAWEVFNYFVGMKNPADKSDNREELTILFLVNIKDDLEALEKIDVGMQKAIKKGEYKITKGKNGDDIGDIFTMIFDKWASLTDME
jgi:hypothetical protein